GGESRSPEGGPAQRSCWRCHGLDRALLQVLGKGPILARNNALGAHVLRCERVGHPRPPRPALSRLVPLAPPLGGKLTVSAFCDLQAAARLAIISSPC